MLTPALVSLKLKVAEVCRVGFAGPDAIVGVAGGGALVAARATALTASSAASAASRSLVLPMCVSRRRCILLYPLPLPLSCLVSVVVVVCVFAPRVARWPATRAS
jgi:hypothetical protein